MHPPPELNYDPIRLLDHVYGEFNGARNTTEKTLFDRAILTPKNKDVDALNEPRRPVVSRRRKDISLSRQAGAGRKRRCLPHGALKLHEPARLRPASATATT